MLDFSIFNNVNKTKTISPELFISHVVMRAEQLNLPSNEYTVNILNNWIQTVVMPGVVLVENGELTISGCRAAISVLDNRLEGLLQSDLNVLFYGVNNAYQMVNSTQQQFRETLGGQNSFSDLSFEAPGTRPYYFPNGSRGISSKYLEAVIGELAKTDHSVKEVEHRSILRACRREFDSYLNGVATGTMNFNNLFIDMVESTWSPTKGNPQTHFILSQDMLLNVGAKFSSLVRLRIFLLWNLDI